MLVYAEPSGHFDGLSEIAVRVVIQDVRQLGIEHRAAELGQVNRITGAGLGICCGSLLRVGPDILDRLTAGAERERQNTGEQRAKRFSHADAPPFSRPASVNRPNAAISTATMVEPTGVPARMDSRMPHTAQNTDSTAEQIVTERKL